MIHHCKTLSSTQLCSRYKVVESLEVARAVLNGLTNEMKELRKKLEVTERYDYVCYMWCVIMVSH